MAQNQNSPAVLIILDGWGHRLDPHDNGIAMAATPYFDSLLKNYPNALIDGSGPAVGLPEGIMGNSEVGHMNLGAGRIIYSGLSQIYNAIENKSFFSNDALLAATKQVHSHNSTLHILGLVSDGAVHSHQDHLYALLELAKQQGVTDVAIHCFLDGRDTAPKDGKKYIQALLKKIKEIGVGRIASLSGRYFAMDRDQNWDRIEKAYRAMNGESKNQTDDPLSYIQSQYDQDIADEFLEPVCVVNSQNKKTKIQNHDACVFLNFRADRARQMSHLLTDQEFSHLKRGELPAVFVAMTPYDNQLQAKVAFQPSYPEETLGELVAEQGWKQLRIAETEKYAHVTFFFNGGQDKVFSGEERVLIPSDKSVATYDLKPEMRAVEVKDALIENLNTKNFKLVICNFANADMVGHTAKPKAIVKALEVLDQCLSEIIPAVLKKNGTVIITADHGNAETMVDENGEPMTAHTTNLVPFVLISNEASEITLRQTGGRLCDVAPTLLQILNLDQPKAMTGKTLIEVK